MQAGLSTADRRLIWGAGILALLLIVGGGLLSRGIQRDPSPVPSSYSTDPDGALAAYLLLQDLGYRVERRSSAPVQVDDPSNITLILAEPSQTANSLERRALLDFITRGGRVVFCGAQLEEFFPLPKTEPLPLPDIPDPLQADLPSHYTRGADSVSIRQRSILDDPKNEAVRLYGRGALTNAAVASIGEGEVVWWSAATPLTNAGLPMFSNLQLFLNTVTNPDGSPREVYWDEYFHGQQGSLWSYIAATPVPMGMWQLGIVFALALFAYARRSGPVMLPAVRSRLSPLEFVDTMGGLYARARAVSVAVEVPYRSLRLELTRRLGRPPDAPSSDVAALAEQRLGLPRVELQATLDSASSGAKFSGKDALALAQALARFSRQLQTPHRFQEKKP